jgi:hypothetical protein
MAAIALTTAGRVEVIESLDQKTLPAGVAVTAGQAVYQVATTGKWGLALATAASNAAGVHIALRSVGAGEGLTAMRTGRMDGFALGTLGYGDSVFLSDTPGTLQTTAGTVSIVLARVQSSSAQPFATGTNATALDKTLRVDCPL